jgi:hypothetical protein
MNRSCEAAFRRRKKNGLGGREYGAGCMCKRQWERVETAEGKYKHTTPDAIKARSADS